jgi:hypothetical protein
MHTVTNFFILNLAVSDVVMCLFAVPFTPLQSFTGKWQGPILQNSISAVKFFGSIYALKFRAIFHSRTADNCLFIVLDYFWGTKSENLYLQTYI